MAERFYMKNGGYTTEFAFLRIFMPKNFSRISPLVYIFWISVLAMFAGYLLGGYFCVLFYAGGIITFTFLLFFYLFVRGKF